MVILLTGGSGALGSELRKVYLDISCPSHDELDITKKKNVSDFFRYNDVELVIHTAALTSVRKCEEEKDLAWKINVEGTRNLVDAAYNSKKPVQFVYISTACVFDGHVGMYKESSFPYPENFYSLTKLLGEHEVHKLSEFLIIRTNFIAKKPWSYPKAFIDRFGTYLFADDVAKGIKEVQNANLKGIIHIVGDRRMSMYDLARLVTPSIEPMTINDYSGPRLTMDMSLDTERWKKYKISSV